MAECYLYKWTHIPSKKWYVGSRTAKNCHLNDGYLTSSKQVKKMILEQPNEWQRTILFVGDKDEIRALETEVLELFNAKSDDHSYNLHNQNKQFVCTGHSQEIKQKIAKAQIGKKKPKQSIAMTGRKRKPEDVKKWADKLRGVPKSEQHKKNLKQSKRKTIYYTPAGVFYSSREAAQANNIPRSTMLNYCKSKDHVEWEMKGKNHGNV
jgi:hypothetical protein